MTIVIPLVLLGVMMVVQFALAYHVRSVASGAAQDGAMAAARENATLADGITVADGLIADSLGGLMSGHTTTGRRTRDQVTIVVRGRVVSLFGQPMTVNATGSASVERFRPQGSTP